MKTVLLWENQTVTYARAAALEAHGATRNIPRGRGRADNARDSPRPVQRPGSASVLVAALQLAVLFLDVSLHPRGQRGGADEKTDLTDLGKG